MTLIERYQKECQRARQTFKDTGSKYHEGYADAFDIAEQIYTDKANTWIPTSERQPDKEGKFLVTVDNGFPYTSTRTYGHMYDEKTDTYDANLCWYFASYRIATGKLHYDTLDKVTAWMPFPNPYKEVEA